VNLERGDRHLSEEMLEAVQELRRDARFRTESQTEADALVERVLLKATDTVGDYFLDGDLLSWLQKILGRSLH
jgi:DNA-directed RNA polymerase specialized sigma24 family protein